MVGVIGGIAFQTTVLALNAVMVWVKNEAGVFRSCNPVVERFYGVSRERIVGKTDYDFVEASLADKFREDDRAAMAAEAPRVTHEWLTFLSDGKRRLFETVKTPMRDAAGNVLGIFGVARDMSDYHQARLTQESLNRALKLIGQCNRAMMHACDEPALLAQICRLAVDVGGYLMAWVGFPEFDADRTVRPVACSHSGHAYLDEIWVSWADSEFGRGPIGLAIRRGETSVNQDYRFNPSMRPWLEAAHKHGFRSSIALPLRHDEATFGAR